MKGIHPSHLILLFLVFLLAGCASMGPQDTDQYIFLDKSETLCVQFEHRASPIYQVNMPDVANSMEKNRREDFRVVLTKLLYAYQLPIEIRILEERDDPGPGPLLEIHAFRFEQDNSGDLVAVISAKLSKYGQLNTLGTYNQRDTPPPGGNRQIMDKAFRDVIRKPLREMLDDLQQHFPTPEEMESVNEPLRPLGQG